MAEQESESIRLAKLKQELWERFKQKTTWGRNEIVAILKESFAKVYEQDYHEPPPF